MDAADKRLFLKCKRDKECCFLLTCIYKDFRWGYRRIEEWLIAMRPIAQSVYGNYEKTNLFSDPAPSNRASKSVKEVGGLNSYNSIGGIVFVAVTRRVTVYDWKKLNELFNLKSSLTSNSTVYLKKCIA
jgi:hypothetical protein